MDVNIALLAGDGIGPEIIAEATKVLDRVAAKFGHRFDYREALVGACAIDATGDPYPDETHAICQAADAVLFGAIGDPKYDNDPKAPVRPEQGLLRMRKSLGLFANLRPIALFDTLASRSPLKAEVVRGTDFICVRELTSGIYFGRPQGRNEAGTEAFDTCTYTRTEIERVLDVAFRLAMSRRRRLTVVDKANVLETSRLWREVAQDMAPRYPEVELEFMFVDNAAMQIVRQPTHFDVIVTENMFGDILTDEASVISGSLGMLPSASVGSEVALFEPIHGSYPQAAGKNIANPMATILSAAMLLEHLGLDTEGSAVRAAVDRALTEGVVTEDLAAQGERRYSTSEVGGLHRRAYLGTPRSGAPIRKKGLQPQRLQPLFPCRPRGAPRPDSNATARQPVYIPATNCSSAPRSAAIGSETRGRQASRASRGGSGTAAPVTGEMTSPNLAGCAVER